MASILYCTAYVLLFSFIILKSDVFRLPQFKSIHTLFAFYLKLAFGVLLWYIYAHHYKNRLTSDIFKYFDDSKIIYNALHTHFADFARMITGIGDSGHDIRSYYQQMNNWDNNYDSTLYNNSHLIIRINALFMLFSGGHYAVHVILMCFISLVGLCLIYKSFSPYLSDKPKELFAAVFLFPSVLLWGSGILKEGLILLGIGITIYSTEAFLIKQNHKLKNALLFTFGCLLLLETKAYVLICMLPCFISEYFLHRFTLAKKHVVATYVIITLLYLGIGFNFGLIDKKFNPLKMIAAKQEDFNMITRGGMFFVQQKEDYANSYHYIYLPLSDSLAMHPASAYTDSLLHRDGMQFLASNAFCNKEKNTKHFAYFTIKKGQPFLQIHPYLDTIAMIGNDSALYWLDIYNEPAKSRIEIAPIKPSIFSLIASIPQTLAISLIRPYPKEIHSAALLIYAMENALVLLLIIFALLFLKKANPNINKIAFCLTYCVLMLILIGLVTPIYGGIERYKVLVMPFLLILLLLIYDKEKVKRLFKKSAQS